ncbi:hypothetical protein V2W45_1007032 [Cenococcum geophilum]
MCHFSLHIWKCGDSFFTKHSSCSFDRAAHDPNNLLNPLHPSVSMPCYTTSGRSHHTRQQATFTLALAGISYISRQRYALRLSCNPHHRPPVARPKHAMSLPPMEVFSRLHSDPIRGN